MKVRRYKANEERLITTALIVHDGALGRIHSHLGSDRAPFNSKWSNLIAKWCLDYYTKYQKAPGKYIEHILHKYAEQTQDEDTVDIISSFLSSLNREYVKLSQEINEKYVVDLASRHFGKVRLEKMAEKVQLALEKNDVEEALEAHKECQPIPFSENLAWANPFQHEEIIQTLRYYEEDRSLIRFKGAMDEFLGPYFERDGFIALAAPEKKGKSYWLQEFAWQALRQRRNVLYYVLGDMSKNQVKHRLYRRATLRPYHRKTIAMPKSIKPAGKDDNGVPQAEVEWHEEKEREGLSAAAIKAAAKKLAQVTATRELRLKLMCAGAGVISASQIEKDVKRFSDEGWIPDVVILDYADLLAAEGNAARMDFRHQINESWKILRRISLDYHLLMITATQAAARSYDAWVIKKKDFSEDKRKNAHVTGMLGINQTPAEKKQGIYRLNWVLLRDGEWTETNVLWTVGKLALACPCLKSAL